VQDVRIMYFLQISMAPTQPNTHAWFISRRSGVPEQGDKRKKGLLGVFPKDRLLCLLHHAFLYEIKK